MGTSSGTTHVPAVSTEDPVGGTWYWLDSHRRKPIAIDAIREFALRKVGWRVLVDLPRLYMRSGPNGSNQTFVHESLIDE
jgi:hypothetical protein